MKAAVYSRYGPPEVLRLADVEKPVPQQGEVLVRVHATTVSVADSRCRAFRVPRSFWLPARLALGVWGPRRAILGAELAGRVEEVGSGVTRLATGDRIYASTLERFGGYAEYACLPESGPIAVMPENLSYEEAAAVPIGALAALRALRQAKASAGQRVLVYGASGSVGTFAVQLAKHLGAHVTGVCSGANRELVQSLGADAVIDYTKESFAAGGAKYGVVLVAVDQASFSDCMKALQPDGVYVNVTSPFRSLAMQWTALTTGKTILTGRLPPETSGDLAHLRELIEKGRLRAVIDRRYPLESIVEAHRYVDQGHKRGNVVVTLSG